MLQRDSHVGVEVKGWRKLPVSLKFRKRVDNQLKLDYWLEVRKASKIPANILRVKFKL